MIIVSWNGRDLLADCLASLQAQTLPGAEIVVVDNGSTDGSVEFVQVTFPQVRVIELPKNYGFALANNIGIRQTKGDKVALLNNDTVVVPQWLAELSRGLDEHPEVGFCASKILNYWQPGIIDTAGDVLGVARAYKRGGGQADQPEFNEAEYVFGACAGAAVYRRSMLDDIGLFDEAFVTNLEDVDLSFRAQLAGYKCMYVPTAVVHHKVGSTKCRMGWTGQLTYRNSLLMWLKNAPTEVLLKYAPRVLADEARRLADSLGLGDRNLSRPDTLNWKMLLAADLELLWLLPQTLRKRRKAQRRRVVSADYIESCMRL